MSIAVAGGGIIGCSVALELARAGHRVTLYERGEIGRASSWAAGGVLAPVHVADYPEPLAELCVASQRMYPDWVASLEAPEVEYRACGMFLLIVDDDDESDAAMLEGERLSPEEARRLEPWLTAELRGVLHLPRVAQVRNNRLPRGVARAAAGAGASIREHSEAGPADRTVIATGAWARNVRPARGQMILASGGDIGRILLWKDRYIIPRLDGRLLMGSTVEDAGVDASTTEAGLAEIRRDIARIAPRAAELPIERAWAGLRPRTADRLPIIGAEGSTIWATGHFRNGILLAPITGTLVREIVEGVEPSIRLEPFAPSRFGPAG